MAYVKNTWATGDVVTSSKLNNIENGIADGGVLVVNATVDNHTATLDHTWQEIHDASLAVVRMGMSENGITMLICSEIAKLTDSDYQVSFLLLSDTPDLIVFDATSADGYPTASI